MRNVSANTRKLTTLAMLAALAIVLSVPVYLALYITYYLTLGMYACVDSVLVQSETPDEVRGTVMSAQSLLQMVGAWLGTGAAGLWLGHGSIPGLWLLCAAVLAGGTAACLACVVVEAGKMPRQAFTKRIKPPKNHGFP